MKKIMDLKVMALEYAKKNIGEETFLYDPVFRMDNDKFVLAYMVVDFVDIENPYSPYRRPTKWFTQDMVTGEFLNYYDIKDKDFSSKEVLPLDKLYNNTDNSVIFKYSNIISDSIMEWQKKLRKTLQDSLNKNTNKLYDYKVVKVADDLVSPKDFIMANVEDFIGKVFDSAFNDLLKVVGDAYQEYYNSLFEKVRDKYLAEKVIDKEAIKNYMNFLKYLWPCSYETINASTNIPDVIDNKFDKMVKDLLKEEK